MKKPLGIGAAVLAAGLFGAQLAYSLTKDPGFLLRPPGAQGEDDFLARCITCGRCIEACPYVALKAADWDSGFAAGTPVIDARAQACRLCEDFPCITACPTAALRDVSQRQDVHMGTAVIDSELCIAIKKAIRCEVCYRVCPLIDEAISIELRPREGDKIHVVFAPVIDEQKCVGCGLCVERCVVSQPDIAIKIDSYHRDKGKEPDKEPGSGPGNGKESERGSEREPDGNKGKEQ